MAIAFSVNGRQVSVDVAPDTPLLWVLRETLDLTGTKFGCGIAQCYACLVHIDGAPTPSCLTVVGDVANKSVVTIEGLTGKVAEAVQDAWVGLDVPQCGYCQSGQVMAAVALLTASKKPSDAEIEAAMSPVICRCATYHRIRGAIRQAAANL